MLKKYKYEKSIINPEYYLIKLEKQYVPEITTFVAQRYYNQKHYHFDHSLNELIREMLISDEYLSQFSTTFCLMNSKDELCCTGRLIHRIESLPFEQEFDLDLNLFSDKVTSIYEFARFASNGNVSFLVIEKMLRFMLQSIEPDHTLVVASLDKKVFNRFLSIKYPIYKLGLPIQYLGSPTVPVGIKISELPFYTKKTRMEKVS